MAYENPVLDKTYTAGADLSALQYRFVELTAGPAAAGLAVLAGKVAHGPEGTAGPAAADGLESAPVGYLGPRRQDELDARIRV